MCSIILKLQFKIAIIFVHNLCSIKANLTLTKNQFGLALNVTIKLVLHGSC